MKDFFLQLTEYFKGKKTFIVGGLMILLGYLTQSNEMMLQGIGLITLRLGIANK